MGGNGMSVVLNIAERFRGFMYLSGQDYHIQFINRQYSEHLGRDVIGGICYRELYGYNSLCPWCPKEEVSRGTIVRREIMNPVDNRWYYAVHAPMYLEDISSLTMLIDVSERKIKKELAEETSAHSRDTKQE